jgi:hypothetical protein
LVREVAKETAKDKSRMNNVEDGMTANHSNAIGYPPKKRRRAGYISETRS